MIKLTQIVILLFFLISCNDNEIASPIPDDNSMEFISGVDLSSYPEISMANPKFYDLNGNESELLTILKENGVNTVRLRIWVNPDNEHSSFREVKEFSKTLQTIGFKTLLTLHYSDSWADPGQQKTPEQWQGLDISSLKDSVYVYTKKVIDELNPNFIQIGNEINTGFLHPFGHLNNNYEQFIELMQSGIAAVRENTNETKIIIHFAGIENSEWFFNQVKQLDYDIIGLSYYPIWHGKSLSNLKNKMQVLSETHQKKILIAETAYPFTLSWNDWTNNIVGLEDQLILPDFPASNEGQRQFIKNIKQLIKELENGVGFCYWGAELISWKGNQASDASPWENQALFNFQNEALPILKEFKTD